VVNEQFNGAPGTKKKAKKDEKKGPLYLAR
jgi:hypothetical protein